ncbi:Intradiol ring-cleavage dioxygenase [Cercophora scortea]|uniref:Intradiol ring-cleavage dioxygenase n=1 Tax=Cercophora scortea TaxID=314031 RepID=A0AAE0I2G2_9PEZI|nr:Intradiol ring-cleavage dioxygenase [Cercophora scortea]
MRFTSLITGALAASVVAAHPGHDHEAEARNLESLIDRMPRRDLSHCAEIIKRSGMEARSIARREELAAQLMKKRGLTGRATPINTSHKSTKGYTLSTPYSTIFATNNTCVLSPEVTEGPYYVAGEYIRKDTVEKQTGVSLTLDIQVLNIDTCKPVTGAYLEIWHTNATGVYSGVSASGNGNSAKDKSNLNATFLRGVQQTDSDGVVQFNSIFPGHYTGRTTHTHVLVHTNAKALANGTIMDVTASHVGQFFYDQDLITLVEATSPYKSNTQSVTLNKNDGILTQASKTGDPFINYVTLGGSSVSGGLLGWIAFGIDTDLAKKVSKGATLYASGGVSG